MESGDGVGGGGVMSVASGKRGRQSERKSERDTKEKKKVSMTKGQGKPGLGRRGPKRVRG